MKKLDTKVDEALFDQAPAPAPVAPVKLSDPHVPGASGGAGDAAGKGGPPASSRFAYDLHTEVGGLEGWLVGVGTLAWPVAF